MITHPMVTANLEAAKRGDFASSELPEDIRLPLHSLQADVRYLIGRVLADPYDREMVVESILNRLSQIETAAYRLANPSGRREDING